MKDMVGGCCVCSDDRGWPENPLVYCDGQSCTVAVHQACYGIVTVPTGPWYCRKCESQERPTKVKCELCPSRYGALKRTDNSGWAHVVCALYIPEVRFGNVTTMEPIQLQLIPQERFSKVCYICEENSKPANATVGACMQCNKSGCKQQFHVTCAQSLGLLCEEAGNYLDNVKYCGYCQHHYSKLKKGGNVKTIPPYKPVSADNVASDSSSEKESTATTTAATNSTTDGKLSSALGKRKSSVGNKSSLTTKVSTNTKVTSSAYQKPVSTGGNSGGGGSSVSNKVASAAAAEKVSNKTVNVKSSAKEIDSVTADNNSEKSEKKEEKDVAEKDFKLDKGKKRKASSRTPTPNLVIESSVPVPEVINNTANSNSNTNVNSASSVVVQKKDTVSNSETDKIKKVKSESLQGPTSSNNSPVPAQQTTNTAPTNTTAAQSPQLSTSTTPSVASTSSSSSTVVHSSNIIQQQQPTTPLQPLINSVVVSVPLLNATLSPRQTQQQVPNAANSPLVSVQVQEEKPPPVLTAHSPLSFGGNNETDPPKMITSEMSGGGLKITFERQTIPLAIDLESTSNSEHPIKRSRSQSMDKVEKGRNRKKNSNGLSSSMSNMTIKKTKSAHNTPPPQQQQHSGGSTTTFINLTQPRDSPPSSPSSESCPAAPLTVKKRGRKSNAAIAAAQAAAAAAAAAQAAASAASSSSSTSKDTKDNIKLFHNGVNAPHMLGNQLNLNSNMAQKMTDHLNSELEAHSIFNNSSESSNLVGPQLHHKVIACARSNSVGGSSTTSGGSGLSSMLSGGGTIPQTLDQLLERQWEQGSQFLMEQAQHFDIASLLSCLHQLRAENLRLEEHVNSLLQRRDHLLAVNARLAIPLTPPATPQTSHPHTVNNIHPAVNHADGSRSRHSGGGGGGGVGYPSHVQNAHSMENGLGPDNYPHSHRSPAGQPQPSPRWS